jgi:peptidoglycan hydrolase-like protein with peptidoglycan-binding domain
MNRSLAAAAALAATLGVAGLAQAQTNPAPTAPSIGATSTTVNGQPSPAPGGATTTPGPRSSQNAAGAQAGVSPAIVEQAQQKLQSQGLYHGPVDGRIGPATQTALSRYQRKEGLPQTAMLDSRTLQHLLPYSGLGSSSTPGR